MGGFENSVEEAQPREWAWPSPAPGDADFEHLSTLASDIFDVSSALLFPENTDCNCMNLRPDLELTASARRALCCFVVDSNAPRLIEDTFELSASEDAFPLDLIPQVRFFVAYPLYLQGPHPVGALCLLNDAPREFDDQAWRLLRGLAQQAEALLRLHAQCHQKAQEQARSRKLSMLYYNVFDSCREPIYVRNRSGDFLAANRASFELVDEKAGVEDLSGQVRLSDYFPPEVVKRLEQGEREVIEHHESRSVLLPPIKDRQFEITISPLIDEQGDVRGVVSVAHDITEEHRQALLLKVLHQGITDYQALMSGERLWDFLLQALRKLTLSDYGLIGEVIDQQGTPSLRIHAITDLIWDEESRVLMQGLRSGDVLLSNSKSLLGRVFAQGETVVTDDLYSQPKQGGFPPDNPRLHNYLGVPIYDGEVLIGMYGIANGHQGYDEALLERLKPFTATCALLINLYRQFAEREQVMQELARARDEAERASQAKSEFLSGMSHELRTPLNAILGFAQLLLNSRRSPLDERQRRQVAHIEKSGLHLLNLINEVLDLSQIEAGRLQLSLEAVSLQVVIQDVVETLSATASQSDVTIEFDECTEDLRVRADYTRLKQVLLNLLSNAIKYNSRPGHVHIRCRPRREILRVIVSDTGTGIPQERHDELFQPFSRLGAEHGAIEGTGIGLSLTKKLVERMAGTIGVDSRHGQGSDFWFELPLALEDKTASGVLEDSNQTTLRSHTQRRWQVLYVEDNPANQRLMEDIFIDYPMLELHGAASAEAGMRLLQRQPIDLILMDIHLPGIDGYQALSRLRQDSRFTDLPIIGLSANAMQRDAHRDTAIEFTDFLSKPLDIAALLNAISTALPESLVLS
ncbi:ATP-binding protein [Halomonas sp. PR-M31]|uniref:ATP-binding protein n=1 Tax=Halomonas sp. PR-M31 TaxID=1471202 RepID=UPI00069DE160|nr:ATP-binding protein [Halomonas sp. PR-M31]